jgi:predicted permease
MKYTRLVRLPWRRNEQIRQDVDDELAFHLEMRARELQKKGASLAEAERLARHQFGDLEFTREYCRSADARSEREARRLELVTDLWQDLRFAIRSLAKSPSFTIVAVLTLAVGIGSTTAIFSFVNGVLLKPLPFVAPDRIVRVMGTESKGGNPPLSYLDLRDLRDRSRTLTMLSSLAMHPSTIRGAGGDPERMNEVTVAGSFFQMLGVRPLFGHVFASRLEVDPSIADVLLSEKLWRRRFGDDSSIVGKTITLDGQSRTVIGVIPQAQTFPADADLWTPMSLAPVFLNAPLRKARFLRVYGRLASGASLESAQAEISTITARLATEYPSSNEGLGAELRTLPSYVVGDVRKQLFVLLGAVGCVLLIACANLANLTLVRAAAREGEMAVRTALGASRGRLLRQSLVESAALSLSGATLGVLLAERSIHRLSALAHDQLPRLQDVSLDGTVLLVTLGIAVFTTVMFGLLPVWHQSLGDLTQALREGGRSIGSRAARRARGTLVIVEVALSIVLLTGAALMIESFARLRAVDPGFRSAGLVTFGLSLRDGSATDPNAWRRQFTGQLIDRLQAAPGIKAAALTSHLPMTGATMVLNLHIDGQQDRGGGRVSELRVVSPDYFSTMGIRLVKGRPFDRGDRDQSPHVVLLNEAAVHQFFPTGNPIGQRAFFEVGTAVGGEIVGIVGNVHHFALDADAVPEFYVPAEQTAPADFAVIVKSDAPAASIIGMATRIVHELDPTLAVVRPRPLPELVSESVSRQRLHVVVLGFFAMAALLLAALGIHGVIAYSVSRRTREIGVRIALGADAMRVKTMVVRQGAVLVLSGIAIGAAGAIATTRLLRGFLFGVEPSDPRALMAGVTLLAAVALLACYLPARRAAAVDPLLAMRAE